MDPERLKLEMQQYVQKEEENLILNTNLAPTGHHIREHCQTKITYFNSFQKEHTVDVDSKHLVFEPLRIANGSNSEELVLGKEFNTMSSPS
jgi:hypothetical protein